MIRNIDMCKLYGAFAVNLMNWARARAGGWVGLFLFFRKFLEIFQTLNRGFSLIEWGQKIKWPKSEEFGLEPERGSWVGLSKNFEKFLKNFKKVFEIFCVFLFPFSTSVYIEISGSGTRIFFFYKSILQDERSFPNKTQETTDLFAPKTTFLRLKRPFLTK